MIKIKRVYEKPAKGDGCRVLVDRLWPRGMKKAAAHLDLWMKEVAPSDVLRKAFHHEAMRWTDFEKKYQSELKKKKDWITQLKTLERERGTVTLLFGAKDQEHNQAAVLQGLLKAK